MCLGAACGHPTTRAAPQKEASTAAFSNPTSEITMAANQPLFGLVIPGRPVITEFQLLDSMKAMTIVEQPATVADITFFLLPSTPIPPGYGAILYYATPPFNSWVLIGSVDPSKPSGVFRTGWATHDEVRHCPVVQLGVSLEP